jgi:photosystem II stability/assembly factor-like uncharacterized protein
VTAGRRGAWIPLAICIAGALLAPAAPSAEGARGRAEIDGFLQAATDLPKAQPADWMYWQRVGSATSIAPGAYARAIERARALQQTTAREASELARAKWTHMGPVNFGGRIVDLAVDPTNSNTVYAAAASGGVWKSTDAGVTFDRAWPDNVTQSLGALAIGSDGTLYAGTGEPNPGGGSIVYGGAGLYRSTDGGKRWKFSGLKGAGAFGRIVVDPAKPKRVYAAAAGDLFVPGGQRGLYLSEDGGKTWTRILKGANGTTGAVDVAINPDDPKIVLAAMWDHHRLPTHRVYAGVGSGVYRSTDGGRSWTRVKGVGHADRKETGRIGVAFAPSDPSRAYAIVANKLDGSGVGLFRSDNTGKTWEPTAASPGSMSQSVYGWWFGRVWVDPLNPNRLFVGGVEVVESLNGGDSFTAHTNTLVGVATGLFQAGPAVHADQHAMVWDPNVPGRVYLGNDGGVYRSDANGGAETWVAAARQGWTQHYSVDVSEQNPSRVVSGLQDNMCQRNYLGGDLGRPDTWSKYGLCGDGLQTLINPQDDRIVYGCAQYGGNCSMTLDGGVAFRFLGSTTSSRRGWWVPLQFDPTDPNVLYYGGNILNRSSDGGLSWQAISPDLTTQPKQLDPNSSYRIYGTITTVAAGASSPKVVYVGTDDGMLWRTSDLGKHWQRLDKSLPNLWVTRVVVDPKDADVAYVAFSGFRNGSEAPHVIKTTNGGKTWRDISGNLPAAPVNEITLIGKSIAVGTDVGVFVASSSGGKWFSLGNNLPTIPVLDLRYHRGTNTLTAATFGHGIQRVTLP